MTRLAARPILTAIVLVVGLLLGSCTTPEPGDDTTSPPVESLPVRTADEVCGDPDEWKSPAEPVQEGAVRAWLCGDLGTAGRAHPLGRRGPADPLVYDVGSAVEKYQSLRKFDELFCAGTQTVTFTLVLEYGDGRESLLNGDLGGCGEIGDGHTLSDEGGRFLEHVLGLWETQRAAGYSKPVDEVGECATASFIRAGVADAVRGVWCSRDLSGDTRGGGGPWHQSSPIPDDVLRELLGELGAATGAAGVDWNTEAFIMLEDQFGDAVALEWLGSGGYAFNDGTGRTAFIPSAELAAKLTESRQS